MTKATGVFRHLASLTDGVGHNLISHGFRTTEPCAAQRFAGVAAEIELRAVAIEIGSSARRNAWRATTVRSGRPLARAVRTKSEPSASIMPERVSRITAAAVNVPIVIMGMIMCFRLPLPPVGSQRSSTANKKISIKPSQKSGTAWPITASSRASQSAGRPRRDEAITPVNRPSTRANSSEPAPSCAVGVVARV